ncbi:hypothetical protein [Stackebrandtia albiflava]|uniref:hypothetical protein n=1 Tax=Stackebrandtia albiflava TaxID=406432 RepID=UPI0011BEBD32|nr:hypothetical protein [Stackebrandtia albiflava]
MTEPRPAPEPADDAPVSPPPGDAPAPADDDTPTDDAGTVRLSPGRAKPMVFVLLTCGFLFCLLCVAGAFAVVVFLYGTANGMW